LLRVILVEEVGRTSRTRPHSYLTSGKLGWECKVRQARLPYGGRQVGLINAQSG